MTMNRIDLDKEAQARGYKHWRDMERDYGKNYADELKRSLEQGN